MLGRPRAGSCAGARGQKNPCRGVLNALLGCKRARWVASPFAVERRCVGSSSELWSRGAVVARGCCSSNARLDSSFDSTHVPFCVSQVSSRVSSHLGVPGRERSVGRPSGIQHRSVSMSPHAAQTLQHRPRPSRFLSPLWARRADSTAAPRYLSSRIALHGRTTT